MFVPLFAVLCSHIELCICLTSCVHSHERKLRDELSHNLFLMLQECNKFREHQSREILITTLEEQLRQREEGLELLKKEISVAEDALDALYRREKMKN